MHEVIAYSSGHTFSETMAEAFAMGAKCPIQRVPELDPPGKLLPGGMFTYGCLRGLKPLVDQCVREGRELYYADNGYIKPGKWDGYFRITRNALMHDGRGEGDRERLKRLGVTIKPWRKSGNHILICPPLNISLRIVFGESSYEWVERTVNTLLKHSDRPIVIRAKAQWQKAKYTHKRPLAEDLKGAWAVVTSHSTATIDALLEGIPVFCTHPCVSRIMGHTDLTKIEDPLYPDDRERWLSVIAANQWTVREIRSGMAWNYLRNTDSGTPLAIP
jgi:hypothetical protein